MDLTFTLHYAHSIREPGNQLRLMVQRSRGKKSQRIGRYKLLGQGHVPMAFVLQRPLEDEEVLLYAPKVRCEGVSVCLE